MLRMSERRTKSRPLRQSPHHHTPLRTGAGSLFSAWRKAFLVLALVLGVVALGGYGLAEPLPERSDQAMAEMNGLAEPLQEHSGQTGAWGDGIDGLAELPAEPLDRAEIRVVETDELSASREKLEAPFGHDLQEWSGPIMRLGFSFVAGFSLGYALAFFLKLTLVIVGGLLLVLFGLQYASLVEVNWPGIQTYYEAFVAWVQPRAGGFREFVISNVPAAGMAGLGLLLGLKKR